MRSRRQLRAVRATLALRVVQASCAATNARAWMRHRRGPTRIPRGVRMLVAEHPDGVVGDRSPDVVIDLTAHEPLGAGPVR